MPSLGRGVLILMAVSVAARLAVLPFLPSLSYDALHIEGRWALEVLHEHLPEYVAFTIYRPPVTYLWQGALIGLFGPQVAYEGRVFLLGTFVLDITAVFLLYAAAILVGVRRSVALVVSAIFSIALVPWELWRDGAHYDHLTLFFASAFAASATRVVMRPSLGAAALLGVAGGLYVGQSPAALYAVPPASTAAVLLAQRITMRRRWAILAVAVLIPLLIAAPIVARNAREARSFATGDQGGPAIMLFVHEMTKHLGDPGSALFEDGTAPDWYRWCYEHAVPPAWNDDPSLKVLARAFGTCFPWTRPDAASWPFDMAPLRAELARTADAGTRELVDRDIADMRDRRYLFAGFSSEQSPRWIGVYGAVSQRLAFSLFFRHPDWTARTLVLTSARYVRHGPFLPARVMTPPAENGMRTLRDPLPFEGVFRIATSVFAVVALLGILAFPVSALRGAFAIWRRRARLPERAAVLLAIPTALVSGILLLGAWDLDRYFMQVTPYVVLSAGLVLGTDVLIGSGTRTAARSALVRLWGEPGTAETYRPDADVHRLARARADVLSRKSSLRREMARRDAEIHRAFHRWAAEVPGPLLEIGTGLSPISAPPRRRVIHTDTYLEGRVHAVASALELPVRPDTVAAVVGIHVLHHLTDPLRAIREAFAALRPGGVVILVEPNHNLLSSLVFSVFHPERFDRSQPSWSSEFFPDTEANQAMAWIIFERDRARLDQLVPGLRIIESRPISSIGSLLTGGYLLRPFAPDAVIDLVSRITSRPPLIGWLAIHRIIVLQEASNEG